MDLSYWEYKTWLSNIDFTIVGSGIVGLNCALSLRKKYPKAKILVLEKGVLPQGASTKNAGFACFGSISEILADLKKHTEDEVLALVQKRWEGVQILRGILGDRNIAFQCHGGHEVFLKDNGGLFGQCMDQIDQINSLLQPVFGSGPFKVSHNRFGFKKVEASYISHMHEGQIDTGKMMANLLKLVYKGKITVLNAIAVTGFTENTGHVKVNTDRFEFNTGKLLFTTNGFASQLLNEKVSAARAQVLITKPLKNLKIKGTFHLEEGYYYFRDIDQRILLGGGRNLDFQTEATTEFGQTAIIQNKLESLLNEVILPNTPYGIDRRWSGIMGTGPQKNPIVKQISNHVYCGVRLGGMGVAIGSSVGRQLAHLL